MALTESSKINLDEVSFIRPILIVLLVLYHAMAIHTGNWELPTGCEQIPVYKFVGRLAYSFMLESFVFISGYVYAYQVSINGARSFWELFIKKFKRLIVPCWIFGVVYLILFENAANGIVSSIIQISQGVGHLWFCIMLFICFMVIWIFIKVKVPLWIITIILFTMSLFSFIELPARISLAMYYLLFFFAGYCCWGIRDKIFAKQSRATVILKWMLFFICFAVFTYIRSYCAINMPEGITVEICKKICQIIYASFGTMALFSTACYITNIIKLPQWLITIGKSCFGVYIFQQFVLKFLYYKTNFPRLFNPFIMPWIAFIVATAFSLGISSLLRKTEAGRKII